MTNRTRLFLYLTVLSLLSGASSHAQQTNDGDMEKNGVVQVGLQDIAQFESDILAAQKHELQHLPQSMQAKNILGWRFLDRNSQSVGKVADVLLDVQTGDFKKIKVDPERLNFVGPLYFDMKAQNLEVEDSVIRCDMDKRQIQDSQTTLGVVPQDTGRLVSLANLSGAIIYDRNKLQVGTVRGAFGIEKDHKITYLDAILAQTRQTVAIPLNQLEIVQQYGIVEIRVTDEQLAVMKRLAR